MFSKVQHYSDWLDLGFVNVMRSPFFLSFFTMCAQKVM